MPRFWVLDIIASKRIEDIYNTIRLVLSVRVWACILPSMSHERRENNEKHSFPSFCCNNHSKMKETVFEDT